MTKKEKYNRLLLGIILILILFIGFITLISQPSDYEKGVTAFENEDFEDAVDYFADVGEDDEKFHDAQSMLPFLNGRIAYDNEKWEKAVEEFSKIKTDHQKYDDANDFIAKSKEEIQAEADKCNQDPSCWGSRALITARAPCIKDIERLANYDFEWTDGMLEPKFTRAIWVNVDNGLMKFVGDSIKFQNRLGAWQNYSYSCVWDSKSQIVLEIEALPGKL